MKRVSVCCIIKNENLYLNDFIQYYLNLGFYNIYIFDNNDITGEDPFDIAKPYNNVTVDKTYRGKHDKYYQSEAYTKYFKENYKKYDYILFCDIDEYIVFNGVKSISEFIESNSKFNFYDSIELCWKLFDDNNLIYFENKPVYTRFTHASTYELTNTQCKSLIKCKHYKIIKFCGHGMYYLNYCDSCGNKIDNFKFPNIGKTPVYGDAWLNHYRFKTIEEFIDIKLKNWNTTSIKSKYININAFFKVNDKTIDKINYIKSKGYEI